MDISIVILLYAACRQRHRGALSSTHQKKNMKYAAYRQRHRGVVR